MNKKKEFKIRNLFNFDRGIYLMTFYLAIITLISHAATWFLVSNELFLNYINKLPIPFVYTFSMSMVFVPLISLIGTLACGFTAILNLIGFYFFMISDLINYILKKVNRNKKNLKYFAQCFAEISRIIYSMSSIVLFSGFILFVMFGASENILISYSHGLIMSFMCLFISILIINELEKTGETK